MTRPDSTPLVGPDAVADAADDPDAVLVDTREDEEYDAGHTPVRCCWTGETSLTTRLVDCFRKTIRLPSRSRRCTVRSDPFVRTLPVAVPHVRRLRHLGFEQVILRTEPSRMRGTGAAAGDELRRRRNCWCGQHYVSRCWSPCRSLVSSDDSSTSSPSPARRFWR